ncbi:MAG: PAS domain-containing sensor histidine kinase [Dehalococcoidia bacterium]|jgi:PAS domain S-box-containing protein
MTTGKKPGKGGKIEDLKRRLAEAEETLRAIQQGEVDVLVVNTGKEEQVFTLKGADLTYRLVMEQMNEGVITLSPDGLILYCNQRFADLTKTRLEKVISSSILNYIEPQAQDTLLQMMEQDGRSEMDLVAADSSTVPIYLAMRRLVLKEMTIISAVVTDLTAQKMKDQIIELKDEFIGMVSHELKTPLTVIMGAVYTVMMPGVPKAEKKQLLDDALASVEELTNIVENLLELSRAQSNRLDINKENIDLQQAAREVVRKLSKRAHKHRLTVEMTGLPALTADPLRIERILYNLTDNAIKYSPEGCDVTVFARADHDEIVVGIRDQGIGMSRIEQARLFKPFERLDKSPRVKGVGLGLMVVGRLVEAHGGRIWVESAPGKGSTFYFTLPMLQSGKS